MRNDPSPSEMADLTFSIRTSDDASTVTPGIAAPDVSFTTPTIALWAYATLDRSIAPANATSVLVILRAMLFPSNANEREPALPCGAFTTTAELGRNRRLRNPNGPLGQGTSINYPREGDWRLNLWLPSVNTNYCN